METLLLRECVVEYKGRGRKRLPAFQSSAESAAFLRGVIPDGPAEHFIVIALDAKNRPVGWARIGVGGMTSCPVAPADVFRFAVLSGAVHLVLGHNHPSGDATPSTEDVMLTRRLVDGAKLLGMRVIDHVVIGYEEHFSFLDKGILS